MSLLNPSISTLLLPMVLFGATLAGCLSVGGGVSFDVPYPSYGDVYEYRGSDGSTLVVEVTGSADRADFYLMRTPSLILSVSYLPVFTDSPTWHLEEALGLHDARIVQQSVECGVPHYEDFRAMECWGDRAMVFTGVGGLPGAFGASAHWGSTTGSGASEIIIENPVVIRNTVNVHAGPDWQDRSCLRYEVMTDTYEHHVRKTFLLGPGGAYTLCPDSPFPVRFETAGSARSTFTPETTVVTYELVRTTQGTEPVQFGGTPPSSEPPKELEWLNGTDPFYVLEPEEGDRFRFTANEAHQAALELVPRYRKLVDSDARLVALQSDFSSRISYDSPTLQTNEDRRRLHVLSDHGEVLNITLQKRTDAVGVPLPEPPSDPLGPAPIVQNTSYEVISIDENVSSVDFDRFAKPRQVTVESALTILEGLNDLGTPCNTGCGRRAVEGGSNRWAAESSGPLALRQEGHNILGFWRDPDSPQPMVNFPYLGIIDGESGAIIVYQSQKHRMPSEGR